MKLNTIIFSVSIITLFFVIDQSNVVIPAPVPDPCRNNCWGAFNLCDTPDIAPDGKIKCVKDRVICIKSCGGARNRAIIALFRAAVKRLN